MTIRGEQYRRFDISDVCDQLRAPDGTGNFNRGNAFNYLACAGWHDLDKQVEDLERAKYFIQREIDRIKDASASQVNEGDLAEYGVKKGSNTSDEHWCPACGIRLVRDSFAGAWDCPNKHGWMNTRVPGNTVWMPWITKKPTECGVDGCIQHPAAPETVHFVA